MSYVVYSIKGGVGKTTLSVQVSQMLNYTYVTNDSHSSAHNLMPEEKGFLVSTEDYDEIPFDENVVYDFGGFKDSRINDIIKQASKIIIPTLTSIVDVQATIATLKDVSEINKDIIIVINRTKNNNKAIELKEYLEEEIKKSYKDINFTILFVRDSSVLEDSLFDCEAIENKAGTNRFKRHIYRNAIEDMNNIKKALKD
ncbi:ParA family protein [Poseidonibacter antarcticus]|uniref:ParA family protein n=1 Tax=Poseidonibacter antarcticus TaxID=2478538 RepID=UPI0013CE7132|nr:ParA family protein [Poseidonibacter antarcticus]